MHYFYRLSLIFWEESVLTHPTHSQLFKAKFNYKFKVCSRSRSLVKIGQDHHLCHHCQGTEAKVTRQRSEVNYLQMVYRCNLCVQYTSETLRALISHLGRVHQNDRSFHVLCGIDGCPRTYKNFYTLRSHFAQKHSAILERERIRVPQQAERPPDNPVDDGANNDEGDGNDAGNDGFDFEREVEQCRRSNVLGLLKIKDEAKVPQTVV